MIYPGTADGGYSMTGSDPNDLEERKRQLVQKLLQGRQSGLNSLHSAPLFGGRGRGTTDAPSAALPSLSFNPFLAMAAGRPDESFQAPQGLTAQALMQAQAGLRGNIGGPAPQETPGGDPTQQAAQAFLGAGTTQPGLDGPGAATPSPMQQGAPNPFDPQQAFSAGNLSSPRHLTGGSLTALPSGWIPRLGSMVAM